MLHNIKDGIIQSVNLKDTYAVSQIQKILCLTK